MSIRIMTKIRGLKNIPTVTKFILLMFADNANDDGVCWPSVMQIAEDCNVSDRTVQAAIKWSEGHGLISRQMRDGKTTVYKITPDDYRPTPENTSPQTCLRPENDDTPPAVIFTPAPENDDTTPENDDIAYIEEPSKNHQLNHQGNRQTRARARAQAPPDDFLLTDDRSALAFYEKYPRKVGKRQAVKAYHAAIKRGASHEIIIAGLDRHAEIWAGWPATDRQFIPHPETWLNQERWNGDDPQPRIVTGRSAQHAVDGLSDYERGIARAVAGLRGCA